jgi:hypothetical protein
MSSLRYISLAALAVVFILAGLSGCGEDNASSGTLTLSITDAPVDVANRVVVIFNGVAVKPSGGESVNFDFDETRAIDLLALGGGNSKVILNSVTLDAGQYNWVRLKVLALQGVLDSYIELDDLSMHSLHIPSGEETGLKVNRNFNVPAGGSADFTIDFDLRKSVHDPEGFDDYMLRPTLRIIDNTEVGSIAGVVDAALINTAGGNAVYVYNGAGIIPEDVGGDPGPVNTGIVNTTTGHYRVGFLSAGQYTAAFTGAADADDPLTDDNITPVLPATVTVTAGETASHDFNP